MNRKTYSTSIECIIKPRKMCSIHILDKIPCDITIKFHNSNKDIFCMHKFFSYAYDANKRIKYSKSLLTFHSLFNDVEFSMIFFG